MFSDLSAESSTPRRDTSISFAHLSDPHLPPPSIPWTSFFNKRLLSRILWKTKRRHVLCPSITDNLLKNIAQHKNISNLLISGDITNFGSREEYIQAANWLKKLPIVPIVVPGNHDFMAPISYQNSLAFWEKWSGPEFPFVRFIEKVAVIGLNSAIPTLPFTAYGYVSKKQLQRLGTLLAELGEQGYCRVVMLHHPARAGLLPYCKSLLNIGALTKVLRKYGAELVLHGHSHDATLTTIKNTSIPLLGVSAASMKSPISHRKASWNHLTFTPQLKGWKINLIRRDSNGNVLSQLEWSSSTGSV